MKRKRREDEGEKDRGKRVKRLAATLQDVGQALHRTPIQSHQPIDSRSEIDQQCRILSLPAELRTKIFKHALGGNLVHVNILTPSSRALLKRKELFAGGNNGFYNTVCSHHSAEDHAQAESLDKAQDDKRRTPLYNARSGDLGHGYYTEAWTHRHRSCVTQPQNTRADLKAWQDAARLDLSLLRVCKQVYKEARLLPYSANTFAFNSAQCFQAFALLRSREKLTALSHLNLVVSIGTAPFSETRSRDWVYALHFCSTGRWINSLDSLSICVELYGHSILDTQDDYGKMAFEDMTEEVQAPHGDVQLLRYPLMTKTSWIEQFAELCRCHKGSHVEIVVADDPLSSWGHVGKKQYCRDMEINDEEWRARRKQMCLTLDEKRDYARRLTRLFRLDQPSLYRELHECPANEE